MTKGWKEDMGMSRLLSSAQFQIHPSPRRLFFIDDVQFFCLLVRYAAKKIRYFKFNLNVSSYSVSC